MATKKELLEEARSLGLIVQDREKNEVLEQKIEEYKSTKKIDPKQYSVEELDRDDNPIPNFEPEEEMEPVPTAPEEPQDAVDRLILDIEATKVEIDKKESRNAGLKQKNININESIVKIESECKTSMSEEDLKVIADKKLEIKENERQLEKNSAEIESLNEYLASIEKEYKLTLPVLISHKAVDYLTAKNKRACVTDRIIRFIQKIVDEEKELAQEELVARKELDSLLAKYSVGEIGNEFPRIIKDYGIEESQADNRVRGYIKQYVGRILPFARKLK